MRAASLCHLVDQRVRIRWSRRPAPSSEQEVSLAVYAIVRSGGTQQKVSVGDVLDVDRVAGEPGSSITLPALLLVDEGNVTVSPSTLENARVSAEILGDAKGPKIKMMKYKNKTGYKRRLGHRQKYTQVKITDIETGK